MIACIKDVVTWFGTIKAGSLCEFDPVTQENLLRDYPDSLIETQTDIRYLFDSVHRHYQGWCNWIDNYHWQTPTQFGSDHHKFEKVFVVGTQSTQLMKYDRDYHFVGGVIEFVKSVGKVNPSNEVFIEWQECATDRDETNWIKSL